MFGTTNPESYKTNITTVPGSKHHTYIVAEFGVIVVKCVCDWEHELDYTAGVADVVDLSTKHLETAGPFVRSTGNVDAISTGNVGAIRARLAAATPGPWDVDGELFTSEVPYVDEDGDSWLLRPLLMAEIGENDLDARFSDAWEEEDYDGFAKQQTADMEFVANAPADLTFLLAEVDRLAAELGAQTPETPVSA